MTENDKALVERLRGHSEIMTRDKGKFVRFIDVATCTEAADRIEALATENERLRGHLASIIADPDCCAASKAVARAALGETQ